jgi:hypothetical protein
METEKAWREASDSRGLESENWAEYPSESQA